MCRQETNGGMYAESDSHVAHVVLTEDERDVIVATDK